MYFTCILLLCNICNSVYVFQELEPSFTYCSPIKWRHLLVWLNTVNTFPRKYYRDYLWITIESFWQDCEISAICFGDLFPIGNESCFFCNTFFNHFWTHQLSVIWCCKLHGFWMWIFMMSPLRTKHCVCECN